MPPNQNIHNIVVRRLALAWIILSIVLGGIVFYLETESTDDRILNLAVTETESFTSENLYRLNQPDPDLSGLRQRTTEFLKSHFVIVELYNRDKKKILEETDPGKDAIEAELKKNPHSFPLADTTYYRKLLIGENVFLQVLQPLKEKNGALAGYFEGVYQVDAETLKGIRNDVVRALILVVVIVLATTLVLYPIIISLNRNLVHLSRDLLKGNIELMEVLGSAIAKRDSDTNIHNYRVTIYAIRLAEAMGRSSAEVRGIISGAFLHDVGKIGISDNILLKPGRLTDGEREIMQQHTLAGAELLAKSDIPQMHVAEEIARHHHEWWNGKGYPHRLAGTGIPIAARITAIVDVFDALTHVRPYKPAWPVSQAMHEIRTLRGVQFDPDVTDLFMQLVPRLQREVGDLDEYLGAEAKNSPFIQARAKIARALKGEDGHGVNVSFDVRR